jgi:hypothetical protein
MSGNNVIVHLLSLEQQRPHDHVVFGATASASGATASALGRPGRRVTLRAG